MTSVKISEAGINELTQADFEELGRLVRLRERRESAEGLVTLVRCALEEGAQEGELAPEEVAKAAKVEFGWSDYGNGRFFVGSDAEIVLSNGERVDFPLDSEDIDAELSSLSGEIGEKSILVLDLKTGQVEQAVASIEF